MADVRIEELLKEDPTMYQAGKYADDATFGFILLSGSAFLAGVLCYIIDGWEDAVFFMMTATYFTLLYIALEKR